MGNGTSTGADQSALFHGNELKWKTGALETALPVNAVVDTYENLKTLPEFKEYMLQNIASDELVNSLLSNDSDNTIALEGISSYRSLKQEELELMQKEVRNLENCSNAGIKLQLSEVLQLLERQLGSSFQLEHLPYLVSIQKRLTIFRELQTAASHARKSLICSEKSRKWSKKSLNSIEHPSLAALSAFADFGTEILDFIPLLVASLKDEQHIRGALKPLLNLFTKFQEFQDLYFFSSWSPRVEPPLSAIDLSSATATASQGDATYAIDGKTNTFWSSDGGEWKLTFSKAQVIDWIRIAWISNEANANTKFHIGAPDKLSIFVAYSKEESKPKLLQIIEPEVEKLKQGSWIQFFKLSLSDVKQIILYPSKKICGSSTAPTCEIYDFAAFTNSSSVIWMNNLKLFSKIQKAFFSAMEIRSIQSNALFASLGVLRGTGSLGICLYFVENFIKTQAISISDADPFTGLLLAIFRKEEELITHFNQKNCRLLEDDPKVTFSNARRSSNCKIISKTELTIGTEAGFCCLDALLLLHAYEWEILITSGKGIRLGVTEVQTDNQALMDKSWLIDIETGSLFIKSSTASSKLAIPSSTGIFKFTFDTKTKQVSLSINGESLGVIFEQVASLNYPVVFFEPSDSDRSVSVGKLSKILNPHSQTPVLERRNEPVLNSTSTFYYSLEVLTEISRLTEKMMLNLALANEAEIKQYLEYPFCLEVSLDVFATVGRILAVLADLNESDAIISLLKILELQFYTLSKSTLQFSAIETFVTEDSSNSQSRKIILENLEVILKELILSADLNIQSTAILAYSRGLRTFTKDGSDWISKVVELFESSTASVNYQLWQIFVEGFDDLGTLKLLLDSLSEKDLLRLNSLITHVIQKIVCLDIESLSTQNPLSFEKSTFVKTSKSFLLLLFEELIVRLSAGTDDGNITWEREVFTHITREILSSSFKIFKLEQSVAPSEWEFDLLLRRSFILTILHSVIYAYCFESLSLSILEMIIDDLQTFVIQVAELSYQSTICQQTFNTISSSIIRKRTSSGGSSSVGGWKTVKAVFEDGDSSFSISDNGTTYTSLHSSNTCALVNHRFTSAQRGAWEFILESDSVSDECSVFGAARQPLRSRCYSSSNDLWMRRSYNGYMYNQGSTTGNNMDKIHPGDVVRIEFNGPEGTLSYSVNGSDLEVGFTDIVDDIYPACGSYRNAVVIKLLKVEVFNNQNDMDEDVRNEDYIPSKSIQWQLPEALLNLKDVTTLQHFTPSKEKKAKKQKSKWLTARGNKGAAYGVHDWEFQFGAFMDGPWSIGFTFNETPTDSTRLGAEKEDATTDVSKFYAWNSDGSLWVDGSKVANTYGTLTFPIKKYTAIRLRINRIDQTASFFVNGTYAGVAFGPEKFSPAAIKPLPEIDRNGVYSSNIIYPASSVFDPQMSIKIRSAGMETSIALPFLSSLSHSATSVLGRLCARMIQGKQVDANEKDLTEWLRSAIFSGGIDSSFLDSSKLEALPANSLSELQSKIYELSTDEEEIRDLTEAEKFILEIAHGYNLDQTDSSVSQFYEWLEKIDPEPAAMRRAFEKNNNYRFPTCELPFIACLLKHAGMIDEAYAVAKSNIVGEIVGPSEEMFLLWQKVKQLRSNLRRKRQQFKAQSANSVASSPSPDLSVIPIASDEFFDSKEAPKQSLPDEYNLPSSINWQNDLDLSAQNEKIGLKVVVKNVGMDLKNSHIYLFAEVCTTALDKKLPALNEGTLKFGDIEIEESIIIHQDSTANTSKFLLLFDISIVESKILKELESMKYILADGWDAINILTKGLGHELVQGTIDTFQSYCNSIAAKSQFLLLMKSAWHSSDASSKSTLLGLSSLYFQRSTSIKVKDEQTRWKTQERWRRVIEFLHVNSKIRRQLSNESEHTGTVAASSEARVDSSLDGASDKEDSTRKLYTLQNKDEVSTAQAAIQASSVFVNSEDSLCSAENLYRLMKTRLQRANNRIKALRVLKNTINSASLIRDPLLLFGLLVVVKNCIPPNSGTKGKVLEKERSHYLINLEGCSAAVLKSVQNSFASLYGSLSDIFTSYLQTWEQSSALAVGSPSEQYLFNSFPPAHLVFQGLLMILKMWTIQFSNRDYGWIADTTILPTLFKIMSFSFQEKILTTWLSIATNILSLDPDALKEEKVAEIKLFGKDFVFSGIQNGLINGRTLLFNLYHYSLVNGIGKTELQQLGLDQPFLHNFNYVKALETSSNLFCRLTVLNEERTDAVESAKKAEAAEKEAEEAKKLKEELSRLSPTGIFDSDHHDNVIKLSAFNTVATLREDRSNVSVCAYATVDYDLNNPGDHGNYFEVTILSVGQGDIGVGFADKKSFSFRDNMPGWIPHSYGYHGDDGKKYGEHVTSGDFPVFDEGDVIGCGIRFESNAIFYTRNGTLLGDAFIGIGESSLTPIVGFSNRHLDSVSVKINFGVEPFVYVGSEVITNVKALEERQRREANTVTPDLNTPSQITQAESGNEMIKSQSLKSVEISTLKVKESYDNLNASLKVVESQLFEHSVLRDSALLLVQYFLVLSSETHLQPVEPKKEISNGHRPPLLKDVSTFGTPKVMTKADESKIQSNIVAALIHELFVGSLYINQSIKLGHKSAHSFAFLEEKLLDYDVSITENQGALLELGEVSRILHAHLTTLNIIVSSSEEIRRELSHSNSLMTFFSLLACPAAAIHDSVISLLHHILPETDPDIVEASIPSDWKQKIHDYESCLLEWKCGKRTRKMPDSFIRMLLLETTTMFHGSNSFSVPPNIRGYGFGDSILRSSQLKFKLLQKLFSAPSWAELIAANLGNAFKNAASLMLDEEIWTVPHVYGTGGERILQYAAVCCGSIHSFPLLIPGSKIEVNNSAGTIVGGYDYGAQLDVVFDSNFAEFQFSKHVESIDRDKVRLKLESCEIDFTTISQPVLPNLLSFTKQLLNWALQHQGSLPSDPLSQTKVMILGILFSTVLSLINTQTEVVMENIQDTNILKDLLLVSSMPVKLPKIINYSDALSLWVFTQARLLELPKSIDSPSPELLKRQVSRQLSRQPSAEKGPSGTADPIESSGVAEVDFIEISSAARKSTDEIASRLSEEFSFPKEFCQACLEFAMLDEIKAKQFLRNSKSVSFADVVEDSHTKSTAPVAVELSDESLVKNIQHVQLSSGEVTSPESILYYFKVENIDKARLLDQEDAYVVEGQDEGLIKYNFNKIGLFKGTPGISSVVTKFYDHLIDSTYYKLLPKNGCYRITAFHHPLALNFKQSPLPIYWTLAILSARNLTKNLLLSGYSYILKLCEENNLSNPLNLIKLITSTDSSGVGASLATICNALPEKQLASVPGNEDNLVNVLIQDAKKQLKDSCAMELNQSKSEESIKEFFRVSSAHPFTAPFKTSGEIVIPANWRGATLSFNKKCQTPNEKATLKFYSTKENFLSDNADYAFFGEYNPSKAFRDLTFHDAKSVFYKFEASVCGHKFPMAAKNLSGVTKWDIDEKAFTVSAKVDSSKPVGLGEDDSLFNLFDSGAVMPTTERTLATIIADTNKVTSGCWRFEVVIQKALSDSDFSNIFIRVGVAEVDFPADLDFVLGTTPKTCGFGNDLSTYVNGEKVGTSNLPVNFSEDLVIDCVIELIEGNYSIAFLYGNQFINLWTGEKVGGGILPAVTFSNASKVSINFGQEPFRYEELALEEGIFSFPILPFVDSIGEEKQNEIAWGYDFVVKPLMSLNLQLSRDFELIWQAKGDDSTSSVSSKSDYTKKIWVWRAKAVKDYVSISDIVTTTSSPPRRSILVFKHQCKPPKSFSCVFTSSKCSISVWRAVPEDGYVSMGDVVTTSTTAPSTSSFVCLPRWAVKGCEIIQPLTIFKKVGDGKAVTNASIWKVDHGYGFFFGSPYEKCSSTEPRHADFKCDGVGEGYALVTDIESLVTAEWKKETEILTQPSIVWSRQLIHSLLTSEKWHTCALNDSVFKTLVNYLRSSTAAAPLEVVPTLILMVRQANKYQIPLSFHDMKNLCQVVLKEAVEIVKNQKKTEIPKALMRLVDLVVEIQIANVLESGLKDRQTISRNIERGKLRFDWMEESKEEEVIIEEKEADASDQLLPENSTAKDSKLLKWWDRSHLDHHAVKLHRVMKKDTVIHLIDGSETILMKLKQALKFLFAVSSTDNSTEGSNNSQLERSFPKLMTSKIWYETISLCQFIQSSHPYREKNFTKKVTFPGVQQLSVQFDRRCSLNLGDKLSLTSGSHNFVLTATVNENYLKKGVEFISNEIIITFESGCTEADPHEWGWAFTIFTSGPAYESAETTIDLESLLEGPNLGSNSANATPAGNSEEISVDEAIERLKSLKLSDIECEIMPEDSSKEVSVPESSQKKASVENDFDSEESDTASVVEATEEGGKPSPMEVGIDSSELYQAEVEELENTRPHSKRGKRDRRVKIKLPGEETGKEKSKSEEKKEEEVEADPTLDIIENLGQLRHADFISVPHAKELEIKIERSTANPNPDTINNEGVNRSTDYSYLLKITGEADDSVITRIQLNANELRTVKVPKSTAHYELFSIKTTRLQQIIDGINKKAEEAKMMEKGEPDKVEEDPVKGPAEIEEEIKAVLEKPVIDWQSLLTWHCSLCTFINTNDRTVCEMCGSANEILAEAAAVTTGHEPTPAPDVSAGWWCPMCTLVNPLRVTTCGACGTARVVEEETRDKAAETKKKDEDDLPTTPLSDIVVSKPSAISTSLTAGDIVKISVKGKFDIIGKFEARLEAAVASHGKILTPLQVHHRLSCWTRECDDSLLEYLNNKKDNPSSSSTSSSKTGADSKLSPPFNFILPKQYLLYQGQSLSRLTMVDILMRTQIIESFNKTLETLLPLIDLGNDDPFSLGAMIRKSNRYLLMKIKTPLLEKAINATSANNGTTSSDCPATLLLDNFKSLNSREKGDKDPTTSQNCFVQAFKQLQKKDSAIYRYIISGDRVFTISFAEESGIDAGGVFREGISRIIDDLFSEYFNLLVLCPNGQQIVHAGMDKYLPNPKHTTPFTLEMFEFIGKLMAMSIRAKLYLPFEFPPLIWKKIVGEEVNKYDLMEIDMITTRQLDEIENCHKESLSSSSTSSYTAAAAAAAAAATAAGGGEGGGANNTNDPITNQDLFYQKYHGKLKYVYMGTDSIEKDLILNGHLKEVTFENRFEYCDLVRKARLNEFDLQIAAIARGMGQVIPMRALLLFSAKQLEELVCGNPKIDIDVWKQNTETSGVSSTTVNLFWKVMESLTIQEQTGFVRFAWGRSRLPSKSEDFQMKMRLTSGGRAALPVSHTCFFSVELPEYRTEEEMRHGLLTAIHYGVGGILNG